ncbi:hypothetical protein CHELA20_54139 [Hyphomicrobiales bacterium]|nr:hypothetical protein CHELA41_20788 [Hyphomicrobiales bacterium]CAH1685666.1 hypothetical protein CHELA20_54139 [Hyphomicrobiales bacterium]
MVENSRGRSAEARCTSPSAPEGGLFFSSSRLEASRIRCSSVSSSPPTSMVTSYGTASGTGICGCSGSALRPKRRSKNERLSGFSACPDAPAPLPADCALSAPGAATKDTRHNPTPASQTRGCAQALSWAPAVRLASRSPTGAAPGLRHLLFGAGLKDWTFTERNSTRRDRRTRQHYASRDQRTYQQLQFLKIHSIMIRMTNDERYLLAINHRFSARRAVSPALPMAARGRYHPSLDSVGFPPTKSDGKIHFSEPYRDHGPTSSAASRYCADLRRNAPDRTGIPVCWFR